MNKKSLIIVLLACLLVAAVLIILSLYLGKNGDGTGAEKKPDAAAEESGGRAEQPQEPVWGSAQVATSNNGISVSAPVPYAEVASPVIVAGRAIAFENAVSLVVRDSRGAVRGSGFATADAPDAGQSGAYRTAVAFNAAPGTILYVEVFEASARDGLPIHMVRIPVRVAQRTSSYSVFLAKEGGPGCPRTFEVRRAVPATNGVARAALGHVFAGPTREEWEQGYRSFVPQEAVIKRLEVEPDGVATLDFSSYKIPEGACAADTARVQIEKTLLQFATVTSVKLSVNGDMDAFLQAVR
ncbi:MAG: GerMN domain-containing protein [Candidatus Magasanikbacteria bacterium]|nr:GerMN domain-containing protein [Candidatus Magasanikbacteria bacterium]